MPITYRKSFRVLPGVRVNVNRKSWSVTLGFHRGPHWTWSSTGRNTTSLDLPGGLGYRTSRRRNRED